MEPERTILVVDDSALIRAVAADALAALGFGVRTAASGAAALAIAERPDLVILDDQLPDLPGRQVLAALRDRWPDLPVLLCTGASEDVQARLEPEGWSGLLAKPFKLADLAAAVGSPLVQTPATL